MKYLSAISYIGNKQKILPNIIQEFPKYSRFIDLFSGGLSVSLNVQGPVIANDIQFPIIDMYIYMSQSQSLVKEIQTTISKYNLSKTNKEGFLNLRDDYNLTKNPLFLLVLQYYSFSNIIRFNSKFEFTAPFGKREFNKNSILKINHFLSNCDKIKFVSKNYLDVEIKTGDFVYADPPYLITCADYNKFWNIEEELKLFEYLDNLNKVGIKFGLSNVIHHKGKTNTVLIDFMKKYNVRYLTKTYAFNAYHLINKEKSQEVYIYN